MAVEYLVPFGVLKLIEFFCLLFAWTTAVNQYNMDRHDYIFNDKRSKPAFHITICIIAWLFTLIWSILNLVGICDKFKMKIKNIVFGTIHFILGLLVLLAASLLADVFSSHSGFHTFKAGATFGIISALVLFVDAVVHVVKTGGSDEA